MKWEQFFFLLLLYLNIIISYLRAELTKEKEERLSQYILERNERVYIIIIILMRVLHF